MLEEDRATQEALARVFALPTPTEVFEGLLPVVGQLLKVDRCFLQIRRPSCRLYRTFCWRAETTFKDMSVPDWALEDPWEEEEPMFRAALKGAPSFFIDDIETSSEVNRELERKEMGHRALIHAHVQSKGELLAVLQPCLFGEPRVWSSYDRALIQHVITRLVPVVEAYIDSAARPVERINKSPTKDRKRKPDRSEAAPADVTGGDVPASLEEDEIATPTKPSSTKKLCSFE